MPDDAHEDQDHIYFPGMPHAVHAVEPSRRRVAITRADGITYDLGTVEAFDTIPYLGTVGGPGATFAMPENLVPMYGIRYGRNIELAIVTEETERREDGVPLVIPKTSDGEGGTESVYFDHRAEEALRDAYPRRRMRAPDDYRRGRGEVHLPGFWHPFIATEDWPRLVAIERADGRFDDLGWVHCEWLVPLLNVENEAEPEMKRPEGEERSRGQELYRIWDSVEGRIVQAHKGPDVQYEEGEGARFAKVYGGAPGETWYFDEAARREIERRRDVSDAG